MATTLPNFSPYPNICTAINPNAINFCFANGEIITIAVVGGLLKIEPDVKTCASYLHNMVWIGDLGIAITTNTCAIIVEPLTIFFRKYPKSVTVEWNEKVSAIPPEANSLQKEIQRYLNLAAFW